MAPCSSAGGSQVTTVGYPFSFPPQASLPLLTDPPISPSPGLGLAVDASLPCPRASTTIAIPAERRQVREGLQRPRAARMRRREWLRGGLLIVKRAPGWARRAKVMSLPVQLSLTWPLRQQRKPRRKGARGLSLRSDSTIHFWNRGLLLFSLCGAIQHPQQQKPRTRLCTPSMPCSNQDAPPLPVRFLTS